MRANRRVRREDFGEFDAAITEARQALAEARAAKRQAMAASGSVNDPARRARRRELMEKRRGAVSEVDGGALKQLFADYEAAWHERHRLRKKALTARALAARAGAVIADSAETAVTSKSTEIEVAPNIIAPDAITPDVITPDTNEAAFEEGV